MTKKFNPKIFQNKQRIYVTTPNANRISRLYIWDEDKKEYYPPEYGKPYMARRYENEKRVQKFFEKLEEARNWQQGIENPVNPFDPIKKVNHTPLFSKVVADWRMRTLSGAAQSTISQYDRMIKHHLDFFMDKHMNKITLALIDEWLDLILDQKGFRMLNANRESFEHEYDLLRTILNYYQSYSDSYGHSDFSPPLRKRHKERAYQKYLKENSLKRKALKEIYLTEEEFVLFRDNINGKFKSVFPDLATVQFYGSLRISEAAALRWEDIYFDWKNIENSYFMVRQHVYWPRKKGHVTTILPGFKNSKHLTGGVKKIPMYKETFEVLSRLYTPGARGLIFTGLNQEILEYRSLQYTYDKALKGANLPFSGTHIMRRGGASMVYNKSGGDLSLVMQQLGVTDQDTALVYVKRDEHALSDFTKKLWNIAAEK
ncbi:MAG: site-specific integrase [Bacteriovoracaceae bacterium]|nr:site-specific integrase [Bacteriovoracaceae bacterium]